MAAPLCIGVLVSGTGTNLQAIMDAIRTGALDAEIRLVVSNVAGAGALDRARAHGAPTAVVSHRDFASREAFDAHVVALLRERGVELVVLAGFNRLLSPLFVRAFPMRIMNIHPALLPSFPGLHAQRQAVEYGVRVAGATVHFVDEETDHGPVIIQVAVPVYPDDTEESLQQRILAQEHLIYPHAIRLFAAGRLRVEGRRVIIGGEEQQAETALVSPAMLRVRRESP
jgi:phosphoribosylglycinamide formyltransferase-1